MAVNSLFRGCYIPVIYGGGRKKVEGRLLTGTGMNSFI